MFAFNTKENLLLMKQLRRLSWVLLAFLAVITTSCDNEPLEGEFQTEPDNNAGEGQFVATIEGESFTASAVQAVLYADNVFAIEAVNESNEFISIVVENAGEGMFDLLTNGNNLNGAAYVNANESPFPYVTIGDFGGSGSLAISSLDTEALEVSGTFNFVGGRIAFDLEGNPVLDENGDPVIDLINITAGAFNSIAFTISEENGGDGGTVGSDGDFFANVDGVEFVDTSVQVTKNTVGGISMLNIMAVNDIGGSIRIDIPEYQGIGTFPLQPISDGTELIGVYKSGPGADNFNSDPGSITITKLDLESGLIEGTFQFTAVDPFDPAATPFEITDGTFSVSFEGNAEASGVTNTFNADVDGVTLDPQFMSTDILPLDESTVRITGLNTSTVGSLTIFFPSEIEVGIYEFTETQVEGAPTATYSPDGSGTVFSSVSGTLTVTFSNPETGAIDGTFEFSAEDNSGQNNTVYEITNGTFSIVL